jgi:Hint domain
VIVRKGALADNVPHHDLRVTKAHSLYIDGVLIPVEFLVNHRSILWDDHAQEVRLYHIELETHDVLLANGAPAESYRDDGNRWLFQNANSGWSLPPQEPYAPVLTGGPLVDAVWRRLLERAGPRKNLPLTDDADLHVLADGQRLDAADRVGEVHMFRLPAIPSALHIVSRAAAPAELGLARDPRMLGVALRRFAVRKGTRFRVTEAKDGRLTEGFHAFEADNGIRWTDGHASSPPELYDGFTAPLELVLHIAATARYLADSSVQCVA